MMNFNLYNCSICWGSIFVIAFCSFKLIRISSEEKIKYYFLLFIFYGCLEILQMILLDNGFVKKYSFILLFYFPFQFLSPFYFSLFTFHYLELTDQIKKIKKYLLLPFVLFSTYYLFLKLNFILGKPFLDQITVDFISSEIEENFTVIYLFVVGYWLYEIVKTYEFKIKDRTYEYVNRQTKWLRNIFLSIICLCVFWTSIISVIYIFDLIKKASYYYGLWYAFLGFYIFCIYLSFPHFNKIKLIRSYNIKEEHKEDVLIQKNKECQQKISFHDQDFLKELTSVVEKNIINKELNVDFILMEMSVSRTQLHRKLKELTGVSASGFVRMIRLNKAIDSIEKGNTNFKQIAYDTGFSDSSYFSKCFKKEFGKPPSEYAKQVQKSTS